MKFKDFMSYIWCRYDFKLHIIIIIIIKLLSKENIDPIKPHMGQKKMGKVSPMRFVNEFRRYGLKKKKFESNL